MPHSVGAGRRRLCRCCRLSCGIGLSPPGYSSALVGCALFSHLYKSPQKLLIASWEQLTCMTTQMAWRHQATYLQTGFFVFPHFYCPAHIKCCMCINNKLCKLQFSYFIQYKSCAESCCNHESRYGNCSVGRHTPPPMFHYVYQI